VIRPYIRNILFELVLIIVTLRGLLKVINGRSIGYPGHPRSVPDSSSGGIRDAPGLFSMRWPGPLTHASRMNTSTSEPVWAVGLALTPEPSSPPPTPCTRGGWLDGYQGTAWLRDLPPGLVAPAMGEMAGRR
jgi:hypothetical protein